MYTFFFFSCIKPSQFPLETPFNIMENAVITRVSCLEDDLWNSVEFTIEVCNSLKDRIVISDFRIANECCRCCQNQSARFASSLFSVFCLVRRLTHLRDTSMTRTTHVSSMTRVYMTRIRTSRIKTSRTKCAASVLIRSSLDWFS